MTDIDAQINKNPLLSRIHRIPGETIRLPSLSKFYTNGELSEDTVNGEITVHPMTMTDELMMKSPDLLFQGTAIERVFIRCSPNIKKPLDLLTSDVDFILTHLRRISFGPNIDVQFKCADEKCGHEQEVSVPLEYFTNESKEIDVDSFEEKFVVHTKLDPREVVLKPITFREFLKIQQFTHESLDNPDIMRDFVLDSFVSVIKSVDTIENNTEESREFIKQWIDAIPREDSAIIIDGVKHIQDWGPTFTYKVKCSKCSKPTTLSTELNPTAFFMQPSSQETES